MQNIHATSKGVDFPYIYAVSYREWTAFLDLWTTTKELHFTKRPFTSIWAPTSLSVKITASKPLIPLRSPCKGEGEWQYQSVRQSINWSINQSINHGLYFQFENGRKTLQIYKRRDEKAFIDRKCRGFSPFQIKSSGNVIHSRTSTCFIKIINGKLQRPGT